MSDRLYYSAWLRDFSGDNMLDHFATMLESFPLSRLSLRGPTLRIYALEYVEPPASERQFEPDVTVDEVLAAARDFAKADCCCELEAEWDLWQRGEEWEVQPTPVRLSVVGPEFMTDDGGHLRVDFGLDAQFLPSTGDDESLQMQQSNLRSIVHFAEQVQQSLPIERRQLWSESGENFAEILADTLEGFGPN